MSKASIVIGFGAILFLIGGEYARFHFDIFDLYLDHDERTPEEIEAAKSLGRRAAVQYVIHCIGIFMLAIGGLVQLWRVTCRRHSFVNKLGKSLFFTRGALMFAGAIGVGLTILFERSSGSSSPHFGKIVFPSIAGLLIGQILLTVIFHKGITTDSNVERPRLINKILFGFEVVCWVAMSGVS
ncbi:MAG: hypothetical protein AAF585_19850, partial [Verrucomicrobiota bacterium]